MYGLAWHQQNSLQHPRWAEGKDNDSINQSKSGDHQKDLQEIPKSYGGRGWRFLGIKFINSILRYFHVI